MNPTIDQLRRAIEIKEKIESLQAELDRVLGGATSTDRKLGVRGRKAKDAPAAKKGRRKMSAAARARMAAAAKARWKKAKASGKTTLAG